MLARDESVGKIGAAGHGGLDDVRIESEIFELKHGVIVTQEPLTSRGNVLQFFPVSDWDESAKQTANLSSQFIFFNGYLRLKI